MDVEFQMIVVIMTISVILGVILNTLVIIVRAVKFSHKRKISSYHFIIVQVAIADLVFAVLIPVDIHLIYNNMEWTFSLEFCVFSSTTKVITLAVPGFFMFILAFERYQGIKHTLTQKWTLTNMMVLAFITWAFTIISFVPFATFVTMQKEKINGTNNTLHRCVQIPKNYPSAIINNVYHGYISFSFLFIPFTLTTFFHLRIYYFIRSHVKKMSIHRQNTTNTVSRRGSSTIIESESSDHKISVDEPATTNMDFERFQCCTIDEVDDDVFTTRETSKLNSMKQTVRRIFNSSRSLRDTIRRELTSRRNRPKVRKLKIHILLAISVCFFFCIFPNHLWFVLKKINSINRSNIWNRLHRVLSCFAYIHCFINGIIYSVMDQKFRTDTWLILKSIVTLKPYYRQELPIVTSRPSRASIQVTSMS